DGRQLGISSVGGPPRRGDGPARSLLSLRPPARGPIQSQRGRDSAAARQAGSSPTGTPRRSRSPGVPQFGVRLPSPGRSLKRLACSSPSTDRPLSLQRFLAHSASTPFFLSLGPFFCSSPHPLTTPFPPKPTS